MSHKQRTINNSENLTCEKYVNRMLRQDQMFSAKKIPVSRMPQEKISHIVKQPSVLSQRVKPKGVFRNQSPVQKATAQAVLNLQNAASAAARECSKAQKNRERPRSTSSVENKDREAWGQILQSNKSREKVSCFSSFDPLRTLHFLSKELFTKLESVLPGKLKF